MSYRAVIKRFALSRAGIAVASLVVAACSKDSSTSPVVALSVPTNITVTAGASQSGVVATTLTNPIVVNVTDQDGKAMANVPVSFTANQNGAAVTASVVTTDASGNAQLLWTLGTRAGTDTMTVTVAGQSASTVVVATALPDAPANMSVVSGNAQNAPAGTALSTALAVKVTDRFGNPVPGVAVQWGDDAGGSLASTTVLTDANGVAQDSLTLPSSAGKDDVVAEIVVNGNPMIEVTFTEVAM